jgi:hypothetical protein
MLSWPAPGDHFVFAPNNDLSVKTNNELSPNFAVLKIDITHVDQLLLQKPLHIRRRWVRTNEWNEERINP